VRRARRTDRLVFRGEAQDLQEMLGSLLDNAGKWTARHIIVSAEQIAGQLCIDIDDDGPGIAADQRSELLRRGQRGDEQVLGYGCRPAAKTEADEETAGYSRPPP
jgi:signal transduction histidine kinase